MREKKWQVCLDDLICSRHFADRKKKDTTRLHAGYSQVQRIGMTLLPAILVQ
jgi:hypothetical protein